MRLRSYVIYGIILALLAGYYAYFEVYRKEKNEKVAEEKKRVFHVDKGAVKEVKVLRKGQPEIAVARKDDGSWSISQPVSTPADKMEVEELLNYMNKVERQSVVAEKKEDLTQFGLQEPSLKISFREGEQWRELIFGDPNPVSQDYYATSANGDSVFIVSAANFRSINKDLFALRDKSLFSVKSDEVEEIDLHKGSFQMKVRKSAGKESPWQVENKESFRVDKDKLEDVIRQLAWLRASSFVAEKDEDLARYGLNAPQAVVTLKKGETNETLLIGGALEKAKDKLYVKRETKPEIMSIEGRYLTVLPESLGTIEDRSIFGLDVDAVRQLTFRIGDTSHTLKREKDNWKWEAPDNLKGRSLESWAVEGALWSVKSLAYNEKANEPEKPFENADYSASLADGEGKPLAELTVGPIKEGTQERLVKAVNKEGTSWYLVHQKTLNDIRAKLSQLKDEKK